uniref:Serine/threonine-protein kinase RIO1 n=1 Tax=Aureoumbra lagunensis TaxID=44058 RepID=A0A7S3JYC4_9STRA
MEEEEFYSDDDYNEAELDALEVELCGDFDLKRGGAQQQTKKMNTRLNIDTMLGGARSSHSALKTANRAEQQAESKPRHTGRDDRATSEQVMDPRTRLILFKLLGSNQLASIDGCISTGKEANVYFAKRGPNLLIDNLDIASLAVKVYKTSVLVFRDRERYINGEHRFQRGYSRGKNPRKMVKLWAEKELRNYKRLEIQGIPAPMPILVRGNVLVMEFLGTIDGWPSPRLKDADLTGRRLRQAYWQICKIMRTMFQNCNLVHGDLSEYNLLWHDHQLFVIDVSQSVESDHPMALDFLRTDCKNITDFFGDKGRHTELEPLSVRELFEFITFEHHLEEDLDTTLERYMVQKCPQPQEDTAVFMDTHLPRSLYEIGYSAITCEREQRTLKSGGRGEAYQQAVGSLLQDSGPTEYLEEGQDQEEEDDIASSTDEDDQDTEDISASGRLPSDPTARALAKDRKRAAAKIAKEARAEKRKTKLKKHHKKRAISRSKSKSHTTSSGGASSSSKR